MSLRLVDLLAGLSRVADLGFGLPAGESLRSAALAGLLAEHLDLPDDDLRSGIYTALLQHVGCNGYAHESARRIGDEFAVNRAGSRSDDTDRRDVLRTFLPTLVQGRSPRQAAGMALRAMAAGEQFGRDYITAACEVGRRVADRLDLPAAVQEGVYHVYELWQGGGHPDGLAGAEIPVPARLARLTGVAAIYERLDGAAAAGEVVRERGGGMLDPVMAEAFADRATELFDELDARDPRTVVMEVEPAPLVRVLEPQLAVVAAVFGDIADLKTPFAHGHSRGVAALARGAAEELGLPREEVDELEVAGLLHDLGRVAVSSRIWEKPGRLTEAEWEQVRLHAYHSERILAASRRLAPLAPLVGMHHERHDGSGYHRGCPGDELPRRARVLAAADAYRTMVEPRPHRGALDPDHAAATMQDRAAAGVFDPEAVAAVLAAAGHDVAPVEQEPPAGLTEREVEVLQLVAEGCSNRDIGDRLVISRRTAEHHVQNIYAKLGVSSRAAAALFAMEHDLLDLPAPAPR